jgi:hypothetical protein
MGRPDSKNAGRSKKVPFISGEDPKRRHERRLNQNLKERQDFNEWCEVQRIILTVKNDGHHWIMSLNPSIFAEWWPSSAKLVFCKMWGAGIHCHDIDQLKNLLIRQWGLKE